MNEEKRKNRLSKKKVEKTKKDKKEVRQRNKASGRKD